MGRIAVYVRGELRLDRLVPRQAEMYSLGVVALDTVKHRLLSGRDASDRPETPLNKYYARLKAKITGRPAVRDYQFGFERDTRTGRFMPTPVERQLLPNLRIRAVSETQVFAENTTMGNIARLRRAKAAGMKVGAARVGARPKNSRMQELYIKHHGGGEWLGFSPSNAAVVLSKARQMLPAMAGRIVQMRRGEDGTWSI